MGNRVHRSDRTQIWIETMPGSGFASADSLHDSIYVCLKISEVGKPAVT